MMSFKERRAFDRLVYPLIAYRGGLRDDARLGQGLSWTTSIEVASFFAHSWPQRWGDTRPGIVIERIVEPHEVEALFLERDEEELLIP